MRNYKVKYKYICLILLSLFSCSAILASILYNYDKTIVIQLNAKRSPFWDFIWLYITHSAGIIAYGVSLFALLMCFITKRQVYRFRYIAITAAGATSGLAALGLKSLVHRIRPFHIFNRIHELGPGGGWSFPSGHTCDAFFLAAMVALLFPQRRILIVLVYFWAILVGISRVYLGVHYLSDVLAGIAISSAMALLSYYVVQRIATGRAVSISETSLATR